MGQRDRVPDRARHLRAGDRLPGGRHALSGEVLDGGGLRDLRAGLSHGAGHHRGRSSPTSASSSPPGSSACTWSRCSRASAPSSIRCCARWSGASTGSAASTRSTSRAGRAYLFALLFVTVISLLFTYLILRIQDKLPLQSVFNPEGLPGVPSALAFNTAVSFTTNTNWQNYAGEQTMTYLSQMLGLTFHQFLSAATGIAVAIALIRGVARRTAKTHRQLLRRHRPLHPVHPDPHLGGRRRHPDGQRLDPESQWLHGGDHPGGRDPDHRPGPGGGHGGDQGPGHQRRRLLQRQRRPSLREPDRPHQFAGDRPLPLPARSGWRSPSASGSGNVKQGIALFAAMAHHPGGRRRVRRLAGAVGQPRVQRDPGQPAVDRRPRRAATWRARRRASVPSNRAVYGAATTGTSTGSVDSAHDSWTPLGGLVPLVLIKLGEITPGGTGSGLYGMVIFAIVAVFLAGLMVGSNARVPGQEDRGPRRQVRRPRHPHPALLHPGAHRHIRAGSRPVRPSVLNPGAHGFTRDPLRLQLGDR